MGCSRRSSRLSTRFTSDFSKSCRSSKRLFMDSHRSSKRVVIESRRSSMRRFWKKIPSRYPPTITATGPHWMIIGFISLSLANDGVFHAIEALVHAIKALVHVIRARFHPIQALLQAFNLGLQQIAKILEPFIYRIAEVVDAAV